MDAPLLPTSASFWTARYQAEAYAYGTEPNAYFRRQLALLRPGRLLLLAEGEGRNAVYAAQAGWQVDAVDFSPAGRSKALQLAEQKGVSLNYELADLTALHWQQPDTYDAVALIYVPLPAPARRLVNAAAAASLAPGGHLILEAFTPRQLGLASGGPKDPAMLCDPDDLAADFASLLLLENQALSTDLHEGEFHQGRAEIVRLLGRRPAAG